MRNFLKLINSFAKAAVFCLLFELLITAGNLNAQVKNQQNLPKDADLEKFVATAQEYSNLYRGSSPMQYRFKYTGTYFAYSDNFEKGDVWYNGKLYKDVFLNLNSHRDELYVKVEKTGLIVKLNSDFVQDFSIGKRNYTFVAEKITDKISPEKYIDSGYYELLYSGDAKLYKKIRKTYSERINHFVSSTTGSQIERIFSANVRYYLLKEGKIIRIKRVSNLLSVYRDQKKDLRQYARRANLEFHEDKDFAMSMVMKYVYSK